MYLSYIIDFPINSKRLGFDILYQIYHITGRIGWFSKKQLEKYRSYGPNIGFIIIFLTIENFRGLFLKTKFTIFNGEPNIVEVI